MLVHAAICMPYSIVMGAWAVLGATQPARWDVVSCCTFSSEGDRNAIPCMVATLQQSASMRNACRVMSLLVNIEVQLGQSCKWKNAHGMAVPLLWKANDNFVMMMAVLQHGVSVLCALMCDITVSEY